MSDNGINENVSWTPTLEKFFSDVGERAECLGLLHTNAEKLFSGRVQWLDLPIVIGGALNGFFQLSSEKLFGSDPNIPVYTGLVSLLVSILSTINSYYSFSRLSESHKICALQYQKLYRFIVIQLQLPRGERMAPADLLRQVRDTYDRLQDISPIIPKKLVEEFRKTFKNLKDVSFPPEANNLEPIVVYVDDCVKKSDIECQTSSRDEHWTERAFEDVGSPVAFSPDTRSPIAPLTENSNAPKSTERSEQPIRINTAPQSSQKVYLGDGKFIEEHASDVSGLDSGASTASKEGS